MLSIHPASEAHPEVYTLNDSALPSVDAFYHSIEQARTTMIRSRQFFRESWKTLEIVTIVVRVYDSNRALAKV